MNIKTAKKYVARKNEQIHVPHSIGTYTSLETLKYNIEEIEKLTEGVNPKDIIIDFIFDRGYYDDILTKIEVYYFKEEPIELYNERLQKYVEDFKVNQRKAKIKQEEKELKEYERLKKKYEKQES